VIALCSACSPLARSASHERHELGKSGAAPKPHRLKPAWFCDHLYLAGSPIVIQKIVFAMLAPFARLRRYRVGIEPAYNNR
jgi:hypothetical protein